MKFQTLALAAALAFAGAAFAAPNATSAPVNPQARTASAKHSVRHMHKVKHHASKKHSRLVAAKHHRAVRMAKRHELRETTAAVRTDVNTGSRDVRMDQALQKFRASHS